MLMAMYITLHFITVSVFLCVPSVYPFQQSSVPSDESFMKLTIRFTVTSKHLPEGYSASLPLMNYSLPLHSLMPVWLIVLSAVKHVPGYAIMKQVYVVLSGEGLKSTPPLWTRINHNWNLLALRLHNQDQHF